MSTVLIIGLGGVGSVTAKKCHSHAKCFKKIHLASRSVEKCELLKKELNDPSIEVHSLDADLSENVIALIDKCRPDLVIHTALPYQDLSIMAACLKTGTHYLDTANYESPDEAKFSYELQWRYHESFKKKGIMALLGSGFDPGVTNVFTAYAKKHHFDEIHSIDFMDANGGNHGHPFATNFNPEINIREITQKGRYYENGKWIEVDALSLSKKNNFPELGKLNMYLLYHEEMESLAKNFPEIKRMRFWMTFSDEYLKHLEVLQNIGLTGIESIDYEGQKIIPLKFLKSLLPDPASLGPTTKGKTCIGCLIEGTQGGRPKKIYIYNISDHEKCYAELGSQAISYTTGVPAMIGAKLILEKKWFSPGVYNLEQFDPDPFMEALSEFGLPWTEEIL